jgi:hypothetical protein
VSWDGKSELLSRVSWREHRFKVRTNMHTHTRRVIKRHHLTVPNAGLLVLNYPETYVFKNWHGTLLTISVLSLSVTFNTFFAQKLHLVVCRDIYLFWYSMLLVSSAFSSRYGCSRKRLALQRFGRLSMTRVRYSLEYCHADVLT